ncbi:MAG: HEPN domain-containing protein [Thermodesulfobacteriota bacterium]|nr:HEPN domain-containing protein [Thermodesulfobacteriota bacterium]
MTDKQTLLAYRLKQAEETFTDAEKMLANHLSSRSIINRAYYAVFYAILALFLHYDINPKTSKHSGVITIFDRDLVHSGKLGKDYSKIAHKLFETRQQVDYKELVEVSDDDARECLRLARVFLNVVKNLTANPRRG